MVECSICFREMYHATTRLKCNHTFHKKCVNKWFKKSHTCPICRLDITKQKEICCFPFWYPKEPK